MKLLSVIFLLLTTFSVQAQESTDEGLIDIYESTGNKVERYSVLILSKGNRFIYKYGVGGCQGEVTGTWRTENKKLKLTNDKEFLDNHSVGVSKKIDNI